MPRRLSPEDREAWERVRATATPLGPPRPVPTLAPAPAVGPAPSFVPAPPRPARPALAPLLPAPPLRPFRLGERAAGPGASTSTSTTTGLAAAPPAPLRMDAATFGRMARGRLRPEARLDLHGMFAAEAHAALSGFVLRQRARGRRLVLVITGKGRGGDGEGPLFEGPGRLRREVPAWLRLPPLAEAVQEVAPAHRRHGGEGALYVYLRGR